MQQLNHIIGTDLPDLWFRVMILLVQDVYSQWNHPSIFARWVFGSTEDTGPLDDNQIFKDFMSFSGYSLSGKMRQLRSEYFSIKQEKQLALIKAEFKKYLPRQTRAAIYFSEPAFDKSSKLKCLDSLYFQKISGTEFDAFLIFRSTELFPKTMMDLYLMHYIIADVEKTTQTKCVGFHFNAMNMFINLIQAPLIAIMLKKYGVSNWNPEFTKCIESFFRKYPSIKSADKLTLQSQKRIVKRVYQKLEEFRLDPIDLR